MAINLGKIQAGQDWLVTTNFPVIFWACIFSFNCVWPGQGKLNVYHNYQHESLLIATPCLTTKRRLLILFCTKPHLLFNLTEIRFILHSSMIDEDIIIPKTVLFYTFVFDFWQLNWMIMENPSACSVLLFTIQNGKRWLP